MVSKANPKILRYRRGKGGEETRLHGLYSVGIGGHISEEDSGLFTQGIGYREAMRREVIALNRCKVLTVKKNIIEIDWIDAFPDTPVLDLKP